MLGGEGDFLLLHRLHQQARKQVGRRFEILAHNPLIRSILAGDDQAIRIHLPVNTAGLYSYVANRKEGGWNPDFEVKDNIEQVFTRFVKEGKATVRVKSPPHDIFIKCDPVQLNLFLGALKVAMDGKTPAKKLNFRSIVPTSVPPIPKTKLIISSKAAYPTLEGFPRTLQILQINDALQRVFDRKILRLQNLTVLNMARNELTSLPEELGCLPSLKCLILSHNRLGEVPAHDARWNWMSGKELGRKLTTLDLCHNKIGLLPAQLIHLKKLEYFSVGNNNLTELHPGIGTLRRLREINVGNNALTFLPWTITYLKLSLLDVTGNPFKLVLPPEFPEDKLTQIPSLLECAARNIVKNRLFYSPELIPRHLVKYLESARYCICRSPCFETFNKRYMKFSLNRLSTSIISTLPSNIVTLELFYCSAKCLSTRLGSSKQVVAR